MTSITELTSPDIHAAYEAARQRHIAAFLAGLPGESQLALLPRQRLLEVQQERLRAIVRHAKAHSAWHRERLAHLDPDHLTAAHLASIPPMTKADLMEHWDEIVCDQRLSLELCDKHLASISERGPAYLLDEYHVVATGGSTGHRAVLVWDFEGFRIQNGLLAARIPWLMANGHVSGRPPYRIVSLATPNPVHLSCALPACFGDEAYAKLERIPAKLPMAEILRRLQLVPKDERTLLLFGYPSLLHEVALAQLEGRLNLAPAFIHVVGEPLLPEAVTAIKVAFGSVLFNTWGTSEGAAISATNFPGRSELIVNEHAVIVEPADALGNPVSFGARTSKVLVTNLTNKVLPIIRYEITDELIIVEPDLFLPFHGIRIQEISGRTDDPFRYADGTYVHPVVLASVFAAAAQVAEYQVHQTERGLKALIVSPRPIDLNEIQAGLVYALECAGLGAPEVSVEIVPEIARHTDSAKLKRYVPLPKR